jgi:uncharacterized protein (UPF0332 family)
VTIHSRDDYIKYRYHRAEESFDETLILAKEERWNAVINRLYYACFYSVIALLLKNDIETQTHDGARTQFGLQFIKQARLIKNPANCIRNYLIIGKKEIMVIYSTMMKN